MTNHDPPTVRAAEAAPRLPDRIEALLTAWIVAADSGEKPSLQHFLVQLETKAEREQFIDLIDQLQFAERSLPLRLREHLVMGGRYELLAPIGSGGMGQVWRAMDRKLDREVAVKVLSLAATAALDLDRLVEREGKLLAKLSHPGIVRIQDSGRDGEHRFLVMELVGGLPLDDLIERARERWQQRREAMSGAVVLEITGPAPAGRAAVLDGTESWPSTVVKIVVELLRTLEAAHGAGVVHRDLKPGNVRLSNGAFPVLLDFGISLDAGGAPGTLTASMFGTAQYSAPEQWDSTAEVGVHTDIYQTGLILYELLTLQRCFGSTSPIETMQAVRGAKYPRPRQVMRSIDRGLEACVLKAMEIQPARRYRSAAEMRADLERLLAGQVPHAAKGLALVSNRTRAIVRRHRRSLSIAAAMVLGAAGFGLLRGSRGIEVAPVGDSPFSFEAASNARGLVVMSIAKKDARGELRFAPLRLGTAKPVRPGAITAVEVQPGSTRIEAAEVGDMPDGGDDQAAFYAVGAASDDETDVRKMEAWVAALERGRRRIDERNGEWLTQQEWARLFEQGRGAAGLEVTPAQLFGEDPWQAGGLRGSMVKRQLKKG